jgi:hypothetical protein
MDVEGGTDAKLKLRVWSLYPDSIRPVSGAKASEDKLLAQSEPVNGTLGPLLKGLTGL